MLNIYKWIRWDKYRGVLNIEYVRTLLGDTDIILYVKHIQVDTLE